MRCENRVTAGHLVANWHLIVIVKWMQRARSPPTPAGAGQMLITLELSAEAVATSMILIWATHSWQGIFTPKVPSEQNSIPSTTLLDNTPTLRNSILKIAKFELRI